MVSFFWVCNSLAVHQYRSSSIIGTPWWDRHGISVDPGSLHSTPWALSFSGLWPIWPSRSQLRNRKFTTVVSCLFIRTRSGCVGKWSCDVVPPKWPHDIQENKLRNHHGIGFATKSIWVCHLKTWIFQSPTWPINWFLTLLVDCIQILWTQQETYWNMDWGSFDIIPGFRVPNCG